MSYSALVRPRRLVPLGLVSVLAMGLSDVGGAFAEPHGVRQSQPVAQARFTALDIAQERGERVEDLSQRTETQQVFANPDGTWTAEISAEPVRVEGESGTWYDLDPTLIRRGSTVVPRHAAAEVVFSGGGGRRFATMGSGEARLAFDWGTKLPRPEVDGATATYRDAAPGADLVLTASGTGFSHALVIRERPSSRAAAEAILDAGARIQVTGSGATLRRTSNGALEARSNTGAVVTSAPAPLVWDARKGRFGDPADPRVATARIDDAGGARTSSEKQELAIVPQAGYLLAPQTRYPVTIDPSFTQEDNGDTWIQNSGFTISQAASDELRVGTYDGGAHVARSFLKFPTAAFAGKPVTTATLWMRNWYANSCSAANINAVPIIEPWSVQDLTWGNQPNFTYSNGAIFSAAYGSSGCPANGANWNLTNLVKGWADGSIDNYGIRLHATSENYNGSWRRYRSINYGDVAVAPRLVVTYAEDLPSPPANEPEEVVPLVSTQYPGIDSYELMSLQEIAAQEGITEQQAVARYGWQDEFTDAVASVADAYPDRFAYAEMASAESAHGTVAFVGAAPPGVAAEFADLPVAIVEDRPYTEEQRSEIAASARDAIDAQVEPGASIAVSVDRDSGAASAVVHVPESAPTASSLRTAARTTIAADHPTIVVPEVAVTLAAAPVADSSFLMAGGAIIRSASGRWCSSGFPIREVGTSHLGLLTAQHCEDDLRYYGYGPYPAERLSNKVATLGGRGDIQYHRVTNGVMLAAFAAVAPSGNVELFTLTGRKRIVVKGFACLYGHTTKGFTASGNRTCARVRDTTTAVHYPAKNGRPAWNFSHLTEMTWNPSRPGDSGGLWHDGSLAVGIQSGYQACGSKGPGLCSLITPIYGNMGRLGNGVALLTVQ